MIYLKRLSSYPQQQGCYPWTSVCIKRYTGSDLLSQSASILTKTIRTAKSSEGQKNKKIKTKVLFAGYESTLSG